MNYYLEKSKAKEYLEKIIASVKGNKIQSIFSFSSPSWNRNNGYRTYMADDDIYILFENEMCLIISYLFIDALAMDFRKMTEQEKTDYEILLIKDYFNGAQDITDFKTNTIKSTESVKLDYSNIDSIFIRSVTDEYSKWIENDIDFVKPNAETFDQITFIMSNGNSFTVCADDAEADGYVRVWSESADCSTKIYNLK